KKEDSRDLEFERDWPPCAGRTNSARIFTGTIESAITGEPQHDFRHRTGSQGPHCRRPPPHRDRSWHKPLPPCRRRDQRASNCSAPQPAKGGEGSGRLGTANPVPRLTRSRIRTHAHHGWPAGKRPHVPPSRPRLARVRSRGERHAAVHARWRTTYSKGW